MITWLKGQRPKVFLWLFYVLPWHGLPVSPQDPFVCATAWRVASARLSSGLDVAHCPTYERSAAKPAVNPPRNPGVLPPTEAQWSNHSANELHSYSSRWMFNNLSPVRFSLSLNKNDHLIPLQVWRSVASLRKEWDCKYFVSLFGQHFCVFMRTDAAGSPVRTTTCYFVVTHADKPTYASI